jgi:hypothetical protein
MEGWPTVRELSAFRPFRFTFPRHPMPGYRGDMSVDAIKEAIAALPLEERHALASWLNELEYDAWDKQMVRDFSSGGRGMAFVEKVKREIAESKTAPLQAGRAIAENQRQRSRK